MDVHRKFEVRCPIHGFIGLNSWEREIISHRAFQRLRRIRQLAWTDEVYPGAMHTRFEHSLGVMHTATLLYDAVVSRSSEVLVSDLGYVRDGFGRDRQLVRLAALLHDVGHAPFSHASEVLFPFKQKEERFEHEDYSAAIVRNLLRDVIEDHPLNASWRLTADDVADLLEGNARAKQSLFWRDLISGQMDADRMDYLLRDSHHAGVQYGKYDLPRVINTVCAIPSAEGRSPRLGFGEGGWHAAEALVLARYLMFTQVYFHKTRVAYDVHLCKALALMLPTGVFPRPVEGELEVFLSWDDWKVLGLLSNGMGGEHGLRLTNRSHYRLAYSTPEVPNATARGMLDKIRDGLGDMVVAEEEASKSWYKTGAVDIQIVNEVDPSNVLPLSEYSRVVKNLAPISQVLLYVKPEHAEHANKIVREVNENERNRQGRLAFDSSAR